MKVRTDLALEERESFDGSGVEIHGVEVEESCDEERDVRLTRVKIGEPVRWENRGELI